MKILVLFTVTVLFSINVFANHESNTPPPVDKSVSLNGDVSGYSTRNFDDKLDFGLVIPTLSKAQVLNFNLSSVLSSKTSVIRAAGQKINVPSNLSLPRQSESYWITIRINKPKFILPIYSSELPDTVAVLEGQIPFERTVETLRAGNPLFSVINYFTFKSFSLAPVINSSDSINIKVGDVLIKGQTNRFTTPFTADRDYITLGLNLHSTLNAIGETTYFPIGIKTLSRPQNIVSISTDDVPMIVTVPKKTFDSSAQDNATAVFPFSLVWGEAQPAMMLPLAKNFVSFQNKILTVDNAKLTAFNVSAFKVTAYDVNRDIILEEAFDDFTSMDLSALVGLTRIRLDVLAIDNGPLAVNTDPALSMIDNAFNNAKYVTRYEKDIK